MAYEGGQSLTPYYPTSVNYVVETNAQNDPGMYQLYTNLLNDWKQQGGGTFMLSGLFFLSRGTGAWGLMSLNAQHGPIFAQKWDAVLNFALPPGDTNLDGVVDFGDFRTMSGYYGYSGAGVGWEMGDFDHDGVIGLDDFLLLEPHLSGLTATQQAAVDAFEVKIGTP